MAKRGFDIARSRARFIRTTKAPSGSKRTDESHADRVHGTLTSDTSLSRTDSARKFHGFARCPAERALADFFTRPLQGNLFRRLREVIMGRARVETLKDAVSAKSQERIGESTVEEKSETAADQPRTDQEEDTCSLKQPRGKGKRASHADALMSSGCPHEQRP